MPAGFTDALVIEEIGYERWRVVRAFAFTSSDGTQIKVPEGFVTDLASVPHLARSLVPKIGYWSQAAVVHDWIYRQHRTSKDTVWTRKQADKWFVEGARLKGDEYNVPDSKRREALLYAGVRIGSLASWETPEERAARLDVGDPEDG